VKSDSAKAGLYEFGGFVLDPERRLLAREASEPIAITGKAFDALVHLVRRAGQVVTRNELADALWPHTVVEDNNLSQTISQVRKALGDTEESGPKFIATVPRRGYQFVAEVRLREARAAPVVASRQWRVAAAGAAGILALTAASLWFLRSQPSASPEGAGTTPSSAMLAAPAEQSTRSATAHAAYLRALSLYRASAIGVSMPSSARAQTIELLDEAIGYDAKFAAALAWRGHVRLDSLFFESIPESDWNARRTELMRLVEEDALGALALDSSQGVAQTTLGRLNMYRGRMRDARTAIDAALQASPNEAIVHHYSAMLRGLQNDHAGAIRSARRALELDARNAAPYSPLGLALQATGDLDGAAAGFRAMIQAAPTSAIGYIALARHHASVNDSAGVLSSLRLAEQFFGDVRSFRVDAAISYRRAGAHADAERLVVEFRRGTKGTHVDPAVLAMSFIALGDDERARALVLEAIEKRHEGMDPFPMMLIARNIWSVPMLEAESWLALRARLRQIDST
jgi:DNA-binding winged helix-turn-helix (wHTH) protein/tetratricopeptide (TPR) repeat protein